MRDNTVDGASKRRQRLLDLVTYIAQFPHDQKPCTLEAIQTFMLLKHGNRRDTVQDYLRELESANVISLLRSTGGYKLKRNYEETLALFAAAGADWE